MTEPFAATGCECDAPRCERDGCQDKPTRHDTEESTARKILRENEARERAAATNDVREPHPTPWERVQDSTDLRSDEARVLDADSLAARVDAAVSRINTRYEGRGNFARCTTRGCKRKTDKPGEPCKLHRALEGKP